MNNGQRNKNKDKRTKKISEYNDNTNEPGIVRDDGSVYQTQQPLNFEKVWLMFQETDKKFQETDKQIKETDRIMKERWKETERLMKEQSQETDRKFQETREEIRETGRIVRAMSKEIGGIGNNIGEVAEDYFRSALKKMKEFAGVKIEDVLHIHKESKNLEGEYDVVVVGKNTLLVVEVKHKLTRDHVRQFVNESLPKFIKVCPEYSGYTITGAVAGMTATKPAIKLAISKGLFVITQSGQKIELLNPEGFEPKEF